jgi:Fe-S-cluster containining protein
MTSRIETDFSCPKDLHFYCTRCALCCGDTKQRTRHILLSEKDAQAISDATSRPVQSFAAKVVGHDPYLYEMRKTGNDRKCIFLQETVCSIYDLRPLICRFYPFSLTTKNGKYKFRCTWECPGIGKGKRMERSFFQELFIRACEQPWTKTDGS